MRCVPGERSQAAPASLNQHVRSKVAQDSGSQRTVDVGITRYRPLVEAALGYEANVMSSPGVTKLLETWLSVRAVNFPRFCGHLG